MPDLSHILKTLADFDTVSADLLWKHLPHYSARPTSHSHTPSSTQTIQQWLASEETPPDVVILPAPSSSQQISTFLHEIPAHAKLFVMERDMDKAISLLSDLPMEDPVVSAKLRLALGENENTIDFQFITLLDLPKCPVVSIFTETLADTTDQEFYNSMLLKLRDRIRMKVFNLATVAQLSPLWQYNTLKNIPFIVRNPGVQMLEGILKNKPAVVVAAGPSLNEAIPHLQAVARQYVVIAVGTAIRPLRRAGIRPDLVVSVDASSKVAAQFETRCDDLTLASSSIIYPPLLPKFGRVFTGFINADTIGKWISTNLAEKGSIMAGGTVTTTALDLAVRMGCNPIVSIGLDLCLAPDGISHAAHTMYHNQIIQGSLLPVPGNYTPMVQTTPQFRTYIEAISDYAQQQTDRLFINATSQGALLQGMELALPSHLRRFCSDYIDAYSLIADCHNAYQPPSRTEDYTAQIHSWIEGINIIQKRALDAARVCNKLLIALKSPSLSGTAEIKNHLEALNNTDEEILNNPYSGLLEMSLRPAFYNMGAQLSTNPQSTMAIEAMRRSRQFFQQVAGSATWTAELLKDSIRQLNNEVDAEIETPENESRMKRSA